MLLSTAYFPPVHYFVKWIDSPVVRIEAHENYQKQSYRNRCLIGAANGVLPLALPILKGFNKNQAIRDKRIGYDTPWQRMHFQSILSAYRHSPFYEYYIDDLMFVWEQKEEFLFDLNWKILIMIKEALSFNDLQLDMSEEFVDVQKHHMDYRSSIHPKVAYALDPTFEPKPYEQVFNSRYGFQANLSILDALFHLGPETRTYLKSCVVKT